MFEKVVTAITFSPSSLYDLVSYYNKLKLEYKKLLISLLFLLLSQVLLVIFLLFSVMPSNASKQVYEQKINYSSNISGVNYTSKVTNLRSGITSNSLISADAGDRISFDLTATNNTNEQKIIDISVDTTDLSEYSKLSLDYGGAFFDQYENTLNWKNIILDPNSSITKSYNTTIMLPLPESPSNGSSFDCKITTHFGNKLTINLNCPASKILEMYSRTLPKIPTYITIFFISFLTMMISYQIIRIRTLKKELNIIRNITTKGAL